MRMFSIRPVTTTTTILTIAMVCAPRFTRLLHKRQVIPVFLPIPSEKPIRFEMKGVTVLPEAYLF